MKLALALIIATLAMGEAMAQTHLVSRTRGTIERMGAAGEGAIHISVPLVDRLEFTPSNSGNLMYVEDIDTTARMSSNRLYYAFRDWGTTIGNLRADYVSSKGMPYDPDRITKRLHITDPQGKDLIVIPVSDRHGRFWHGVGSFLSRRLVNFEAIDIAENLVDENIFDLETTEVWTWGGMDGYRDGFVVGAPDGEHFAVMLRNVETGDCLLFVKDKLVFPYYDAAPPSPTDAPETYDQRIAALVGRLKRDYGGGIEFTMDRHAAWSADSRYVAILALPAHALESKALSAEPTVLLVDTKKIGPDKDFIDYSIGVQAHLSEELKSEVANHARHRPASASPFEQLRPRLDESRNCVLLTIDGPTTPVVKLEIPLPPDWRDRTIRDSGGIIN